MVAMLSFLTGQCSSSSSLKDTRRSNIIACLAVVTDFTSYDPRRILHHCTYLDLKLPATGLLCGMVLTQEGANVGRVQHLAITCLQVQDQLSAQLVVQQYHIQSRAVYPITPLHIVGEECDDAEPPSFPSSMETDMMNLMGDPSEESSNETLPPPPSPPKDQEIPSSFSVTFTSSATGGKAGISIISNPSSLPPGSFPDFALVPRKQESSQTKQESSQPTLPSTSVDIGVKSKGILLNALKIRPSVDSQISSNTASMIAPKEPPNSQTKVESEQTSSPGAKAAINHSEAKSSFDLVNKKPEKNAQTNSPSAKIRKVAVDMSKLVGPVSSNDSAQQQKQKEEMSSTEKEREEDEWEKASMTISRSLVDTDSANGTNTSPEQQDLLKSLAQQVASMQQTLNSLANEKKSQAKKGGSEMTAKQLSELKSGIIQEVTKGVGNLVLSSLEEHSAEAVAKILGSEQWREEVINISPTAP